jgi:DTW domain-containing protein YfiP
MQLLLRPNDTSSNDYPEVPVFDEPGTVLLYPTEGANSLSEVELRKVNSVIFIDSTWQQSKGILRDERLASLPRIAMKQYTTLFWRHQNVSDAGLAPIKAIYYFFREYALAHDDVHCNQFDDLL